MTHTQKYIFNLLPVIVLLNIITMQHTYGQTNIPSVDTHVASTAISIYKLTAYLQNDSINYVRTWEPKQPYSTEADVSSTTRTVNQVNSTTQYLDGLGRPIQTVNRQLTPDKQDMVSPEVYDAFGNETYKFLPYQDTSSDGSFKQDPFNSQNNFYKNTYPIEQPAYSNEQVYYSKTYFEASPLNRVVKTFAPGNNWAGSEGSSIEHSTQIQYLFNQTSDSVRIWNIANDTLNCSGNNETTNIPTTTTMYGPSELAKNVTIDEEGNEVIEYKDKQGEVVLKKVQIGNINNGVAYTSWICTYYVYDDFGLLRFVIPPKAVANLAQPSVNWQLSSAVVAELCFRYEYDSKNRMIAKKIPGAGWVYMVYDQLDRLVFTQDANMRLQNQWMAMLYDSLDRPILTGIISYSACRNGLQDYVNNNTTSQNNNSIQVAGTGLNDSSDLIVNTLQSKIVDNKATNSITWDVGFTSDNTSNYTAEIVPADNNKIVVNNNPLPLDQTITALTVTYYDNYTETNKTYDNSNIGKLDIGTNDYGELIASQASSLTKGLVTVTRVRVIENVADLTQGKWLETASFYDEKDRAIQVNCDNYKSGQDIVTSRYDFKNKVICGYMVHNNPAAGISNLSIKTNMDYDFSGRLLTVTKEINDDITTIRTITQNSYDALGQLKNKKIGQKKNVNGTLSTDPLEDQDYAYNIRGWLKGINWQGYGEGSNTSSKVDLTQNRWFGIDLSYDWGYTNNQFNGNIAGQRWESAGDGAQRSYGYGYDNANRLLYADFNQNNSGSWNKSLSASGGTIDFSVKMGDGINYASAYDENGNIHQMRQNGLLLNTSPQIDNLTYNYNTNSNKLSNVSDGVTTDNKLGDFMDNNTSGDDYGYDQNGNLITDKNKRLNGTTGIDQTNGGAITYNYLNLPYQINMQNTDGTAKGTITYIYDAAGNKLEKRTNEFASSFNNNTSKQTITTYIEGIVYQNDTLQFLSHEEGRIRPSAASRNSWIYDYFIKDHLGNVRTVLTDEQKIDVYPAATLEDADTAVENKFYTINTNNIVLNPSSMSLASPPISYANNNGFAGPGNSNPTATSLKMYKLNGGTVSQDDKTGLGITLKVMAGDVVNIFGKSYYFQQNPATDNSNNNLLPLSIITGLLGAPSSAIQLTHDGVNAATIAATPANPDIFNFLTTNRIPAGSTKPRAYINYIILDEHFQYVSGNISAVGGEDSVKDHSSELQNITIPKNGYIYVYCSNESPVDVYFDNLQVVDTHGPLLEETQYYPFGLTMKGISDNEPGSLINKYLYNGKEKQSHEFSDGSGLDEYDYGKRMQDPQLGRWWDLDPKADLLEMSSPYVFCYNNPMSYKDPDGDLAILINGLVGNDEERGNISYWDQGVIDAIKNSGIAHSDKMMFVDGDRHVYTGGADFGWGQYHPSVNNTIGGYMANQPEARYLGGIDQGHRDFDGILSKLAKDTKSGKIIEKIQIYTHSRGAAFGAGYTAALLDEISKHADLFADPNDEINLVYNMAPHQSWGVDEPFGVDSYSDHHDTDPLSGNQLSGTKANFSSDEKGDGAIIVGPHSTGSFSKDVAAFTKAFVESKGDSKQLIKDFKTNMQQYGIKVEIH